MDRKELTYLSCADTAKLLRAHLKRAFPEVRFRVRSSNYSGGASISVAWVDGPNSDQVGAISQHYAGASFDGMIDMQVDHLQWLLPDGTLRFAHTHGTVGSHGSIPERTALPPHPDALPVRLLADYVFCTRSLSQEFLAELLPRACKPFGFPAPVIRPDGVGGAYADTYGLPHEQEIVVRCATAAGERFQRNGCACWLIPFGHTSSFKAEVVTPAGHTLRTKHTFDYAEARKRAEILADQV